MAARGPLSGVKRASRGAHSAWLRRMFAVLLSVAVLLVGFGAAASGAQSSGVRDTEAAQAGPIQPADSPVVGSSVKLPPVPAGYVTKDIGWLKLSYPEGMEHWGKELLAQAQEFKPTVVGRLGQPVLEEVHVRLAADADSMKDLAPKGAPYPQYAAGVAYSRLGLILLTAEPVHPGDNHDLPTTFRHELAHVALADALAGHRVPLWFNEGLAIHLSGENTFARTQALATASIADNLLPIAQLDRRFPNDIVGVPLAYAQSADIVRFLLRTQDQERFRLLVARLRRGQAFDRALSDSYGVDVYNLERQWLEELEGRFTFWPALFSGTVIWTIGVVLVTVAWRRKRLKQRETLRRWAREEAVEAERERRQRVFSELQASLQPAQPSPPPAWIVDAGAGASGPPASGDVRDSKVPKVRHEGDWHTLH